MLTSSEIRQKFFDFFESKNHKIVPSAPIVVKNDPTLMFTNAGMNQFKEIFIGNIHPPFLRVANSQKCLRVSGKHNDLEEVGHDGYHHTMFEMLGNWSFGDYFKEEAIDYAWAFLTEILKIEKDRLYATIFEGDSSENLEKDVDSFKFWKKYLPENHIIDGNKKDNFWEMGEQGPCGPCSEIHIDLRDDIQRKQKSGEQLVNTGNELVIEIWNLVFIQYNRLSDKTLLPLPQKHVDTGMGLERLTMVMQKVSSNYNTDLFIPIIKAVENLSPKTDFKNNNANTIATHVISDHIRAIAFTIADGQLPSNTGAGYVIRRILRRAIRYGFTFLDINKPFLYKLLPTLIEIFGKHYPELIKQQQFIEKVIEEEESAFLKTLETGLRLLNEIIWQTKKNNQLTINGEIAFELYDTYGFPADLTQLILKENGLSLDQAEFNKAMQKQKSRSKAATTIKTEDWVILQKNDIEEFIGYDELETNIFITKYRKIRTKNKEQFQLVFNITPFYAESGGQVGDTGYIENDNEKIDIIDTQKEHNLIIHIAEKLPQDLQAKFHATVDNDRRLNIANNHSSTHLLHFALRKILGNHVEQRGSLVTDSHLRFDFSHFQKLSDDEINLVEKTVNELIRANYHLEEMRNTPYDEAIKKGAMALFGEKYSDVVRVIKFGDSIELCGGTHAKATGQIGLFKITTETSVAAGIRRIEAVTGSIAEEMFRSEHNTLKNINYLLKSPKDLFAAIENLKIEKSKLEEQINNLVAEKNKNLIVELYSKGEEINNTLIIIKKINVDSAEQLKQIAFDFRKKYDNFILVLGTITNNKPNIVVSTSDDIVKNSKFDAGNFIKEIAKEIKGGGGGQPFLATAGGSNSEGIDKALELAYKKLKTL